LEYRLFTSFGKPDNESLLSLNEYATVYPLPYQYNDGKALSDAPSHELSWFSTKRFFDIIVSSVALITGFPFFALLVLVTRITSGKNVFYKQQRIGKNGQPFYIYKFRSMYLDAEIAGPQLAKDNDPRITAWGRIMRKTRLDELPQFLNVFLGQMSIVGPRPERRFYIEKILEKAPEYKQLLTVKPGITSIGQVRYGYAQNVEQMVERMHFDLTYLKNQNLSFDLSIIAETVTVMLQGKGK
jgi:putative colanic acid biosynthesis UDP-glucose lipid carrier transferase